MRVVGGDVVVAAAVVVAVDVDMLNQQTHCDNTTTRTTTILI